MTINGKVRVVGAVMSGTSQQSGNAWKKQEYEIEFKEHDTDNWPQRIMISLMNERIEQMNLQVGTDVQVTFELKTREYNGRFYQDVVVVPDGLKRIDGVAPVAQPGYSTKPTFGMGGFDPSRYTAAPPSPSYNGSNDAPPF